MSALSEQETTINYNREEKTANIWTSDRTVMTKLDRLCENSAGKLQMHRHCQDKGR